MQFGDIDLSQNPEAMPPLPLTIVQRRSLRRFIVSSLETVGCTPDMIFTFYPSDSVHWEIPSLYTLSTCEEPMEVRPPNSLTRSIGPLHKAYLEVMHKVRSKGLTDYTLEGLTKLVGPLVMHPLVFSREENPLKAGVLFDVEFAVLVKSLAAKSLIQGGTCFSRLDRHYLFPYIGVVEGKWCGEPIDEAAFFEHLYFTRGSIRFATKDLYDRVYQWAAQNYPAFEHPDAVLRALSLLKLSQSTDDYHEFEQQLHNLQPMKGYGLTVKAELYTDDAFECIREAWLQVHQPMDDRVKAVFDMIVPYYMDGGQFVKSFGVDPTATKKTKLVESKVIAAMDKFTSDFLQTQKDIRDGKFVGMELK